MQELEKILEEIDQEKKNAALSIRHTTGYKAGQIRMAGRIEEIIRKHMNDGWIPVVRGLPELNEDELSEDVLISFSDSYSICIGFYDFNEKRWYVHGLGPCIGRVIAWRPLPEPYRPERTKP